MDNRESRPRTTTARNQDESAGRREDESIGLRISNAAWRASHIGPTAPHFAAKATRPSPSTVLRRRKPDHGTVRDGQPPSRHAVEVKPYEERRQAHRNRP